MHLVHVQRPDPALPEAMIGPDDKLRRRQGFALTDHAVHRSRDAERNPLLRALSRARQGQLLERHSRQGRRRHDQRARHSAPRLSARREDFRDARAAKTRRRHRRAGHRHRGQPDVPGHRPSHLQRLHEGLHLSEAGAGQHSADRDRRAHRCAEHAVGRRDLRSAHALESAQRAAAVRVAVQRPQRAGRRPRPGGLHARALSAQRGLRRRRHRRPEDRAAPRRAHRRGRRAAAARSASGARSIARSTTACSRASAASRSTASPSAGTRTSSR